MQLARAYGTYRDGLLRPFPGAVDLLARLRAAGRKTALITNGFAETHREKVALLGLEGSFDTVVFADQAGLIKPDPRIFLHACEQIGVAPSDGVMVGDRYERDVRGAAEAGLATVWLNPAGDPVPAGGPEPDAIVASFDEVAKASWASNRPARLQRRLPPGGLESVNSQSAPRGLDTIVIRGAREHNLKNVDLTLPRNRLIVITGLSGSGKSSLAFDTIYAEGQRRYVESLSSYARQFLGQMDKPDVDYIEGLSPAISIDQKSTSRNPRSTVGTVTEIYDYLRLLFARIGQPHCYKCGREVSAQSSRADRRSDPRTPRRLADPTARAGHPRAQGRVPEALRGDRQGGVLARPGRRRDARAARKDRPRPEAQAHDRGRSSIGS